MSEFKFACPNCQQNIAATSEYSGAQINCPVCQTPIVVPAAPDAVGAPASKFSKVTSHSTATPFVPQIAPLRKKKKLPVGLYAGWAGGACAVLCVILFWHSLSDFGHSMYAKYVHHEDAPPADQAPTNAPPPPPPELTAEEVLDKVSDKYKSLTTYAVQGQSVAAIDISELKPGQGVQNSTEGVALELGRTNLYRLEWERAAPGTPYKGATWSAGKGDFIGYGPYPPTKMKNRETAMTTATTASQVLCVALVELFFDETNSLAKQADAFARTNGPGVEPRINGRDCYVLDGQFDAHDLIVWVDKETFLIPQMQFVFGGKLDETKLKGMPLNKKNLLTTWAKLKGTITETYQAPQLDKTLAASAFESQFAPTLTAADGMQAQPAAPRREPTRGAGSATQLTRRVREPQPQ